MSRWLPTSGRRSTKRLPIGTRKRVCWRRPLSISCAVSGADARAATRRPFMPSRINRAIELLAEDQAIYYVGAHTGHVLTAAQGAADAATWADYINVGMEHGAFDMTGLADYLRGLVDGGPTRSGHRTPTVIVEAPVNGT